jgi:redox-sensitive bicupin YhaK (pirin superfamily)
MRTRPVSQTLRARPTTEGAGVRLHRVFGFGQTEPFDPFLLLDDFRSDRPEDWRAGFPWHPHRGIETITYVLAGSVEHQDSLGNRGVIGSGDVQWMTAGRGIIHQEMPKGDPAGRVYGFQLWANLPARLKMTAPRYQEVKAADIPLVTTEEGARIRVVCGSVLGTRGPVEGVAANPTFLDVTLPPGTSVALPTAADHTAFAYAIAGDGRFAADTPQPSPATNGTLSLFGPGDRITATASGAEWRFLFASGRPLREPVAWRGPVVMNTREELDRAFREIEQGTFLGR